MAATSRADSRGGRTRGPLGGEPLARRSDALVGGKALHLGRPSHDRADNLRRRAVEVEAVRDGHELHPVRAQILDDLEGVADARAGEEVELEDVESANVPSPRVLAKAREFGAGDGPCDFFSAYHAVTLSPREPAALSMTEAAWRDLEPERRRGRRLLRSRVLGNTGTPTQCCSP